MLDKEKEEICMFSSNSESGSFTQQPEKIESYPFFCFGIMLPWIKNVKLHQSNQLKQNLNVDDQIQYQQYAILNVNWYMINQHSQWHVPSW